MCLVQHSADQTVTVMRHQTSHTDAQASPCWKGYVASPSLMFVSLKEGTPKQRIMSLVHPVQRCAGCREVAALGRSLAAVGGRLEALLVAAASQGPDQEALTSSTILTGPPSSSPIWGVIIYSHVATYPVPASVR